MKLSGEERQGLWLLMAFLTFLFVYSALMWAVSW